MLIYAAVRDREELAELGLPIWARWVRVQGAAKQVAGSIGDPVQMGAVTIHQGDIVVLDADGAAVVAHERGEEVLAAARARADRERVTRTQLAGGALTYDLYDLGSP
jgi:4-hydroxy-4-methyl-2-oxoglutarate aldolase